MVQFVKAPVIRTQEDLEWALARLDVIIDAPDGSIEAGERTVLSDLVAAYEDRSRVLPLSRHPE